MTKTKILLVDDDADICEFLSYNLTKEGYQVYTANDGRIAIEKANDILPDLIILDVMMPEMNGFETCERLRKIDAFKDILIIFLTARGEDYSQITGFDAGADDYITKPIHPKLLVSKVKSLLKRSARSIKNTPNSFSSDLIIDKEKHIVLKNNEEIILPRKEFKLLVLLTSSPNKVFTRKEIYDSVWGSDVVVGDRTIDVHIRKLREKIGDSHIKTIKGVGYKFKAL